ncbi:MAG: dipeptidase [Tepidanaerobacteraceae bacterium]|jgi:membrane dipeptidase
MINKAEKLHKDAIVIDATCPLASYGTYFKRWISGGITVIAPTVADPNDFIEATMHKLAVWFKTLRDHSDKLLHVTTVEDIFRAKKENKLGIIFAFQNTNHFNNDLNMIEVYQRLGIRMVQLCYNVKNSVGDGCTERTDCGLSKFGMKVIFEMNRVGIVIDLSHTGYKTTMEAIEVSQKPVIFSHSNVNSVCYSHRNLFDNQIKAVASKGGVVGINGYPAFVANKSKPNLNDFLRHVDYAAELVGTEHISLGIDYDVCTAGFIRDEEAKAIYNGYVEAGLYDPNVYPPPPWYFPEGIEVPDKLPNLTAALMDRGYSEKDIKNILGNNLIRVFKEVWNVKV